MTRKGDMEHGRILALKLAKHIANSWLVKDFLAKFWKECLEQLALSKTFSKLQKAWTLELN